MLIKSNHSFHMVDQSPWPISAALAALIMTTGMTKWFSTNTPNLMMMGMFCMCLTTYQWWRDITREGTYQGLHSMYVVLGLRWGMILFITSEILFFFSFFWAFFHNSLAPSLEIGMMWPPLGVTPFNATQVPLLNTMILLSSGVSVTWSHHAIIENNYSQATQSLIITIILGIYFSALQGLEYYEASFSISDSAYGASFFIATGFHGIHVLIGTTFLFICATRMISGHFSKIHHFGFEAAAWYWHFVDVVWLFLYVNMYWWGS
uniref:Cytochrome c oxidase subunit 3 n=1 Tax=Friesea gretae TaxID=2779679 RepID=A0A899IKH4_9HEXA|nr:cytochrome c oxidase subunit III [Friesea gretae]QSL98425.1 cytochrome c oxidase subunit III [Friesea gretae]